MFHPNRKMTRTESGREYLPLNGFTESVLTCIRSMLYGLPKMQLSEGAINSAFRKLNILNQEGGHDQRFSGLNPAGAKHSK